MRSGFTRGLFVGTVVGSVASILVDPKNRDKAKDWINQGGQLFKRAGDKINAADDFVDASREMLCEDQAELQMSMNIREDDPVARRMAFLERRLEELEQREV